MKLEAVARTMAAVIAGRIALDHAARTLGASEAGLAVYVENARKIRLKALGWRFPRSRRALGDRWDELADRYFLAHPMRGFDIVHACADFPAFVREHGPAWCAELADFEWQEWEAEIRPRDPDDDRPDDGPLRTPSTLRLRAYEHDLVDWIERPDEGPPRRDPIVCAFWQDRDGDSFRNALRPEYRAALADPRRADPAVLARLREADLVIGVESPEQAERT